ncbi:MAG: hypothetical protein RJA53_1297, partial [Bacteroidota bacterium]
MSQNRYQEDRESLKELLQQYRNLKLGRQHQFLEEESFLRIIDYFDEKDNVKEALEAVEIGLSQFPFASALMIKKADLLIVDKRYLEALDILETSELYDNSDIDLYILKTDAYLALDQPEKAAELLEDAIHKFEGDEKVDLLFELADVYDDYESFEKVFDCLVLILEQEPANEEA